MIEIIWGNNNEYWNLTEAVWAEVEIVVGPKKVYGGDLMGFKDEHLTRLKRKSRADEDEEDMIVVIVRGKDHSSAKVSAKLLQAKLTAELVDKERFQIHIIDESSQKQLPEVYFDSDSPGISAELL